MIWRGVDVRLEFQPRDVWVGLYWRWVLRDLHCYVCVLPMLPLHVVVAW